VRLAFAMLADAASVAEGKLYVHGGCWNQLTVEALPAVHPSLAFVFVLEMATGESAGVVPLSVELVGDGGPVATMQGSVRPAPGDAGSPLTSALLAHAVTLTQVPLAAAGLYRVRITSAGRELGSVDLSVVLADSPDDMTSSLAWRPDSVSA
jgi:hypothetical protein